MIKQRTVLIILSSRRIAADVFGPHLVKTGAILYSILLTLNHDLPDNEKSFTPNQFSINQPFKSLPPGNFHSQIPANSVSWKNVQQLVAHVGIRLVKEYQPTLLLRSKFSDSDETPLTVNDFVWILKDKTPRAIWPPGRVMEVLLGRDGQRVLNVKTAYGTYVCQVSALTLLLAV